jgi:hypothetical protein
MVENQYVCMYECVTLLWLPLNIWVEYRKHASFEHNLSTATSYLHWHPNLKLVT